MTNLNNPHDLTEEELTQALSEGSSKKQKNKNQTKIGTLVTKDGNLSAELHLDGWHSENESFRKYLNTLFGMDNYSPADGIPGYELLAKAAKDVNGEVEYEKYPERKREEGEKEVIY